MLDQLSGIDRQVGFSADAEGRNDRRMADQAEQV
jgi:hypothetical protein